MCVGCTLRSVTITAATKNGSNEVHTLLFFRWNNQVEEDEGKKNEEAKQKGKG